VTATSPLRGPKSMEGGGFAAAHFRARRAGYGAASPASRALRVSCGNGLRPPWTPETSAAPGGQEERAGAGPAPARRAARRPAAAGGCRYPDAREQMNWRSITRRRGGKITQMQARAPGPVASSQQSHLAKLRHTKPGVHETRDAPAFRLLRGPSLPPDTGRG